MAAGKVLGSAGRNPAADLAKTFPVSIILPVHNGASFILDTLESLFSNDLANTEILLVDDASTDGTMERVTGFRGCRQIQIIRTEEQRGPAAARNLGSERARHPYLLFLDADVLLPDRALFWIRDTLDLYSHRSDVVGVLGSYSDVTPHSNFLSQFKNLSTIYLYQATDTLSPFLHTPILLLSRRVFREAGGFDASLRKGEDFRLGLKLGVEGYRLVIDRRLHGVHLKHYSLASLLKEDWERIRSLSSLNLNEEEKRFSWTAHRWNRIWSLAVPGLSALALGAALVLEKQWIYAIVLLLLVSFLGCNIGLFRFLLKKRGWWFASRGLAMQFLEMAWAEVALSSGFFWKRQRLP